MNYWKLDNIYFDKHLLETISSTGLYNGKSQPGRLR